MDDAITHGDPDSFISRFGIARATCQCLTADFATHLNMELRKPAVEIGNGFEMRAEKVEERNGAIKRENVGTGNVGGATA
jgi:hypothetical protein